MMKGNVVPNCSNERSEPIESIVEAPEIQPEPLVRVHSPGSSQPRRGIARHRGWFELHRRPIAHWLTQMALALPAPPPGRAGPQEPSTCPSAVLPIYVGAAAVT